MFLTKSVLGGHIGYLLALLSSLGKDLQSENLLWKQMNVSPAAPLHRADLASSHRTWPPTCVLLHSAPVQPPPRRTPLLGGPRFENAMNAADTAWRRPPRPPRPRFRASSILPALTIFLTAILQISASNLLHEHENRNAHGRARESVKGSTPDKLSCALPLYTPLGHCACPPLRCVHPTKEVSGNPHSPSGAAAQKPCT